LQKLESRIATLTSKRRMKPDAVFRLVTEMSDLQKLSLLQLLKIGATSPEVRSVVLECRNRGLDVDGTLAEVIRRFADKPAPPIVHH
jgi:hypothetical protein